MTNEAPITNDQTVRTDARLSSPGHWLVVIGAFLSMLTWTWGTWPDPVVDFGREIYVPWRLSEGEVLYRDIVSYFNGPFCPYLHALLFRMFGASLRTLVIFNIGVAAAIGAIIFRLTERVAGATAASAGSVTFFILFAFAQFLPTGNYNYVCPYSYELTHGIALTLAMMLALDAAKRTSSRRWCAAAGICFGLIWLTKAEISLAASVAAGAYLCCSGQRWREVGAFAGCAIAVVVAAFVLLASSMPASTAARGMLGSWRWIGDRTLLDMPYFKEIAGTLDAPRSIRSMLVSAAVYLAIFLPAAGIATLRRSAVQRRAPLAAGIFVLLVVLGLSMWDSINWNLFASPMPVFLAAMVTWLGVVRLRRRQCTADLALPLALCAWALALLAKIPLNVRIYHYGFALAMPGAMVAIAVLVSWIPRRIDRAGGNGAVFRAAALAVLVVALYAHIRWMNMMLAPRTTIVAAGADRFRADTRGAVINRALAEIARTTSPRDTLLAVPEGLFINFLSRRVNPTGQLNFTPPAVAMYGQEEMLRAIERRPPDLIAMVSTDSSEYGARYFGQDYARTIGQWIDRNYQREQVFEMQTGPRQLFRIVLLRLGQVTGHTPASGN